MMALDHFSGSRLPRYGNKGRREAAILGLVDKVVSAEIEEMLLAMGADDTFRTNQAPRRRSLRISRKRARGRAKHSSRRSAVGWRHRTLPRCAKRPTLSARSHLVIVAAAWRPGAWAPPWLPEAGC